MQIDPLVGRILTATRRPRRWQEAARTVGKNVRQFLRQKMGSEDPVEISRILFATDGWPAGPRAGDHPLARIPQGRGSAAGSMIAPGETMVPLRTSS